MANCVNRKLHIRLMCVLLAVIVLAIGVIQPPRARALVLVDDAMIATTLLILGSMGVTFAYQDGTSAKKGVSNLIEGFFNERPHIPPARLFPPGVPGGTVLDSLLTGLALVGVEHAWNEFINWLHGSVEATVPIGVLGEGDYMIGGVPFYNYGNEPATRNSLMGIYNINSGGHIFPNFPDLYMTPRPDLPKARYICDPNSDVQCYSHPGNFEEDVYYYCFMYSTSYKEVRLIMYPGSGGTSRRTYLLQLYAQAGVEGVSAFQDWVLETIAAGVVPSPLEIPEDYTSLPEISEDDEPVYIPTPDIGVNPAADSQAYTDALINAIGTGAVQVPRFDPSAQPAPSPSPDIDPDGDGSDGDSDGDGSSDIDIGGLVMPDISEYFPFCIPFDLIALVSALNAPSEAPIFRVPVNFSFAGYSDEITIDLTQYERVAEVIRWGTTVMFVLGLIVLTRKLTGG